MLSVDGDTAVLLSYFRNNVVHLFTASAWIACCFLHNRRMGHDNLLRLGRTLYPFLQGELFLPWDADEFAARIARTLEVFEREGLLQRVGDDDGGIYQRSAGQTDEVFRLRAIGHPLQQAFERYYIAISVLARTAPAPSGGGWKACASWPPSTEPAVRPAAPDLRQEPVRGFIRSCANENW